MKFNDLLKELKETYKIQEGWYDDELYDVLNKIEHKEIANNLDIDKHRWYERSTVVYEVKCDEGIKYLGVNCITQCYSESSSISDCYGEYEFFEMEKIEVISYRRIK